jgi:hypothetical protein
MGVCVLPVDDQKSLYGLRWNCGGHCCCCDQRIEILRLVVRVLYVVNQMTCPCGMCSLVVDT